MGFPGNRNDAPVSDYRLVRDSQDTRWSVLNVSEIGLEFIFWGWIKVAKGGVTV